MEYNKYFKRVEIVEIKTSEIKKDNVWVWDTLWKPKSKAKLKINIAETVRLDERGHIKMWLFTSKIGTILKRTSKKSTYELL